MLVSITAMAQSQLITGKSIILPPLGIQQNVGNLVDNIILSPNGKYAITTDSGFNETLWSIDAYTGMLLGHIDYPSASPQRTVFITAWRSETAPPCTWHRALPDTIEEFRVPYYYRNLEYEQLSLPAAKTTRPQPQVSTATEGVRRLTNGCGCRTAYFQNSRSHDEKRAHHSKRNDASRG